MMKKSPLGKYQSITLKDHLNQINGNKSSSCNSLIMSAMGRLLGFRGLGSYWWTHLD